MSRKRIDGKGLCCPKCGGSSFVTDSRAARIEGAGVIRRQRACEECRHRWPTNELAISREQLGQLLRLQEAFYAG